VIAFLHRGDAAADVHHDAGAFMAENGRKQAFGIGAGQREFVGVADTGGLDLDQHFALARAVELDGGDLERFAAAMAMAARTSMAIPQRFDLRCAARGPA
jgi:hypothetical protein